MTAKTLEEEAREAAEAYRKDSITNGDNPVLAGCYSESFMDGYLAAATARDKEIENLRHTLSHRDSELWAMTETAKSFAGKSKERAEEIEELRARDALWNEYVTLLATELQGLVGLAVAHGWQGNQASFEKGVQLRAALGIEPIPLPEGEG